jgi:hypothetical protein
MPLPPLEPLEPTDPPPMPLPPLLPLELDETPALPRVPAEVDPALRLAVLDDELLGTDEMLLPAEDAATAPATAADLAVAALTREDASAADLLVAATPPPVPEDCPDTDERAASSAVLREADCEDATVDGVELLGAGGGE